MAVLTQLDVLGQMRVDASHLRYIEYASVGDWDTWAGQIISGRLPIVIRGFTINPAGIGGQASALLLNTQDSALLNYGATDSGTIYYTNLTNSPDALSATNPNVNGTFQNGTNYVGIDLLRSPDDTTSQSTAFLVPLLDEEVYKTVDLGITLKYQIVISLTPFSSTSNIVPIASVLVSNGIATQITDCRPMMFRLGSGSSGASATYSYAWPGSQSTRLVENSITSTSTSINPFDAVDKYIPSQKQWQDAVMSRIWEIGGGSNWYSPATGANDINFVIAAGGGFTITGSVISWTGLSIGFTNSNSAYNTINNGSVALTISGRVAYVTLDRANSGTALTVNTTNWNFLFSSPTGLATPGTPYAIAWNINGTIYARGTPYPIGITGTAATISTLGVVELYSDPSTNTVTSATSTTANPIVPVIRNNGSYSGQVLATGISTPAGSGFLNLGTQTNDTTIYMGQSNYGTTINLYGGITTRNNVTTGSAYITFSNIQATGNASSSFTLGAGGTSANATAQLLGSQGSELTLVSSVGLGTLNMIGNNQAWPANGTANTSSTLSGSQINAGYNTGQNPLVLSGGGVTDSVNSVGVILNTENVQSSSTSTTTGRIASIRNNNTEKAYIDNNGLLNYPAVSSHLSPIFSSGMCQIDNSITVNSSTFTSFNASTNIYSTGGVTTSVGNVSMVTPGTYKIDVVGSFQSSAVNTLTFALYQQTTMANVATATVTATVAYDGYSLALTYIYTWVSGGDSFSLRVLGSGTSVITPNLYLSAVRIG